MIKFATPVFLVLCVRCLADIEFTGYVASKDSALYALADTASGRSSWVKISGVFEGFTILEFKPDSQTLVLTRGLEILRLPLKDAKILDRRVRLSGRIRVGSSEELQEYDQINLSSSVTTSLDVGGGVVLRLQPELLADGTIAYHCAFDVAVRSHPKLRRIIAAPTIVAQNGEGFRMNVEGFEFSFVPDKSQ